MHELIFLQDLAIVMTVSAVIMIFCRQLNLPVVLGYILAGLLIGPHTPPFPMVKDLKSIHTLSELGVIFLLFTIGLEFSLGKLKKVGVVSVIAAVLEIVIMLNIGYFVGRAFGWSFMDSLFLGAILCISSTTIIAKLLVETGKMSETFAQLILGILIVEDLLAIVIIAVLSGLATTGTLDFKSVGMAMMEVMAFVSAVIVAGFLFIPRFLRYVDRFKSPEMLTVSVLGLCFGGALAAAKLGFSVALGAFLVGAIIAETRQAKAVIHHMEPLRDMFTAIFFVSVGMMIKPSILIDLWQPILVITLVTILGKLFSCSLGVFFAGYNSEVSLRVGLGLSQIGEFSFIIAALGESTKVTSDFLYPAAVSVSAVTTLSTPFLMKNTVPIIEALHRVTPRPITTFLGMYTSWLAKSRQTGSGGKEDTARMIRKEIPRLVFYILGGLIVLFGSAQAQVHYLHLSHRLYWLLTGLFLFPAFLGAAATLDRMLWKVLLARTGSQENSEGKGHQDLIHQGIRFVLMCSVGVVFLFAGTLFAPDFPWGWALSGLVLIAGLFVWGSIKKTHERIEKLVIGVFDPDLRHEEVQSAKKDLARLIQEDYPGEVETQDFLLPYKECGINVTLRELAIRSVTGASVVSIYRDPESLANPSADTRLLPGDVLLLMGNSEQISAAVSFLREMIKKPAPSSASVHNPATRRVTLSEGSPVCGRRIREVHLGRKTGVQILGLQRGSLYVTNPGPDFVFEAGDELVLFGSEEQIAKASDFLSKEKE